MKNKICILGAGISGLSLAYFLKKKYGNLIDLTILEKSNRVGGWIQTIQVEDFLFELGPRSCRLAQNGFKTLQLADELGLLNQILFADREASNRYIYLNQKLEKCPTSFYSFLRSPLTNGVFKYLLKDLISVSKAPLEEESISGFIKRKFNQKTVENLFDPLTSGIYAGNVDCLSLKSCFPSLYQFENQYGSLMRGFFRQMMKKKDFLKVQSNQSQNQSIFTFENGMETIVQALYSNLKNEIHLSKEVLSIDLMKEGVKIHLNDEIVDADYLFSTIPATRLSSIINHVEMRKILSKFHATSVAVVSLGYKKKVLKMKGFGYLIPSKEKESILGVVFDSSVFKLKNQENQERLTVMIGGEHFTNFKNYKKREFLDLALKGISKHLGIHDLPDVSHVEIAEFSIPQYLLRHEDHVLNLNQISPPHVRILGASISGVSVNDCIANSESFVNSFQLPIS